MWHEESMTYANFWQAELVHLTLSVYCWDDEICSYSLYPTYLSIVGMMKCALESLEHELNPALVLSLACMQDDYYMKIARSRDFMYTLS